MGSLVLEHLELQSFCLSWFGESSMVDQQLCHQFFLTARAQTRRNRPSENSLFSFVKGIFPMKNRHFYKYEQANRVQQSFFVEEKILLSARCHEAFLLVELQKFDSKILGTSAFTIPLMILCLSVKGRLSEKGLS